MTGDAAAQRALEEALVLLGGSEFQRGQGVAALKALVNEHSGSRAAEVAFRMLAQRTPYQPPPEHLSALRTRWNAVQGLGHPGLPRLIRDLFANADPVLAPLRREAAERLAVWLDAEAETLRGASATLLPQPRDQLLPPSSDEPAAAVLAAAMRRWREAAAVHRLHRLRAALDEAEAACDCDAVDRAMAEAAILPLEAGSTFQARAGAIRAQRTRIEALVAACHATPDQTWDTEAARSAAARQLSAWRDEGLPAADRPRADAALEDAARHQEAFLRTTALACRSPDSLAEWQTQAERVGAESPDADVFEPALRDWADRLSASAEATASPEALDDLAGALAEWRDRLPGPVAAWMEERRAELGRYAALWRHPNANAGDLPSAPVLPPPKAVRARIEALLRLRAEARRQGEPWTGRGDVELGDAELESVFERLAALAREAHGDPEIDAITLGVGEHLFRLRLTAALDGGPMAPVRTTVNAMMAAVKAAVPIYKPLLKHWPAFRTLAGVTAEAAKAPAADPAVSIDLWRRAASAAAELPSVAAQPAGAVVTAMRDAALDAVEENLAAHTPDPAAEAALLTRVEEAAVAIADVAASARIRALGMAVHRRALDAALEAGDAAATDAAVAALAVLDSRSGDVARGRLHAAFLRARDAGTEALLDTLSDHWNALAADPPRHLVDALAEAAQAAADRGGGIARRAAHLVGQASLLAAGSPRTTERLVQLDTWFKLASALAEGAPEGPALLVRFLSAKVPETLMPALKAAAALPAVSGDPVVMALLHHGGRRLPRPLLDGPDPLVALAARSREVAGAAHAVIAGADCLSAEMLTELRGQVRVERETWNTVAYHFACLPFTVPPVTSPFELDAAERRLASGLALLDDVDRAADTDLRRPEAVRRCELLRDQILADTPPGALRALLLDRVDRLSRASALPARWSDWQAAVAAARHPAATGVFNAAATVLDGVAAMVAAAGVAGRTVERLSTSDAAKAVGTLGPALGPSTAGLALDGLAGLLRSLELDEARVRKAVRTIREAAPRIPVGGRLNEADPRKAGFLSLFAFPIPLSYRAYATVHALLDDQDFDFLRRVEPSRFPAWLAELLRGHDDA